MSILFLYLITLFYLFYNGLLMKRLLIFCFLLTFLSSPCFSRDFVVELVEEYYKEVQHQSELSYSPFIYHSIQISFKNKPKLLILTGKNHAYRQWLRQYIAQNRYFIVKVSNDEDNVFKSSQAYKIDVANIYPFKLSSSNDQELFQAKKLETVPQKSDHRTKGKDTKEEADKQAAEQKRLEQEKVRKAEAKRRSAEDQKQKEGSGKERLAREKKLNAKAAKDALEEQKRREKADKELSEREKELRSQAEREAAQEQLRRKEADKRWLEREKELRKRAIQDVLEERKRRKEADKRWARRKRSLKASRYYRF
jgi:hypothetical protein